MRNICLWGHSETVRYKNIHCPFQLFGIRRSGIEDLKFAYPPCNSGNTLFKLAQIVQMFYHAGRETWTLVDPHSDYQHSPT